MKSRIFNITQYEVNPKTGTSLNFNEDNIKKCVSHKTIKQYAYIRHDKDVYSEEEYKKARKNCTCPNFNIGSLKPAHWHIVLRCNDATEVSVIAKWLGIPDNQVDVPKGHGAFLDCVQYLSHEDEKQQEQGKHLYSDEEIRANFDFRKELNDRQERLLKYGKELTPEQQIMYDIMYNGLTLKQAMNLDKFFYMEKFQQLSKMRNDYLSRQPVPLVRVNFYISGIGGAGKGVASRSLARSFFPDMEDDDIFFEVGSKGSSFEGYDGQPIIIWNDKRAIDLLEECNGRDNVFEIFDTHPSNHKQNIKYGSIKLINSINIVNSVQPYNEFLDALAGEYTKSNGEKVKTEMNYKGQSWRRFFCCVPLYEKELDILLSKYNMGLSEDPTEYETWKSICGSFKMVRTICQNNEELARHYEAKLIEGLAEKTRTEILEKKQLKSDNEIKTYFEEIGLGKEITRKQDNNISEITAVNLRRQWSNCLI